jgi:exodeoxyribonuclease VII small subunit
MTKQNSFEAKLARLEEIAAKMEDDSLNLDECAKLFEEGLKLSKALSAKLAEIKFKVERLKAKNGELSLDPFEDENA